VDHNGNEEEDHSEGYGSEGFRGRQEGRGRFEDVTAGTSGPSSAPGASGEAGTPGQAGSIRPNSTNRTDIGREGTMGARPMSHFLFRTLVVNGRRR
jgi:hypothetical protein